MTTLALRLLCGLLLWSTAAFAQPLGTFRWQLQPYCNVVTLSVTQTRNVYTLDGFDDQCGGATRAPVTGTAIPNPDGTIGIGLNIVTSPDAAPVHVAVPLSMATLGGPWKDSAGNAGTFAFVPSGGTGGSPRPATTLGLTGVSLGFGLSTDGSPGQVTLGVDLDALKSGLAVRENGAASFAIGPSALQAVRPTAPGNTAIGNGAASQTTSGDFNTAVGRGSLTKNTTGGLNTAIGAFAIANSVTGERNTAVGTSALERVLGSNNTALGTQAFGNLGTGSENIGIGWAAGSGLLSGSNNIYVGSSGVNQDSFTTRIGHPHPSRRAFIHGIRGVTTGTASLATVHVDSAGQLGTISSSRRFKEDIADLGEAARGIQRLRPVSFKYREPFAGGAKPVQFGLIAEDVADVLPELVVRDATGAPETVAYHVLPTLLLAEVQRLERERLALIEAMERRERVWSARIDALAQDMAVLRAAQGVKP